MRAARFLIILIALAAAAAAAIYVFRLPLAGAAIRAAMAGAGLENPEAQVSALTIDGVRLEKVSASAQGRETVSLDAVEADYRWRELILERRVKALRAGPGFVRLQISEDGTVSVPGLPSGGGGGARDGLPFDSLSVEQVALFVDAPDGAAEGVLSADYSVANGGNIEAALAAESLAWKNMRFQSAELRAVIGLSADGQAELAGGFDGDIILPDVTARGISLQWTGEGASWRDAATGVYDGVNASARIEFDAPTIRFADATTPGVMNLAPVVAAFGGQIDEAALQGALDLAFSPQEIGLSIAADRPLVLSTPEGAALSLTGGGAPLYNSNDGRESASFQFTLIGEGVNASGGVNASRDGDFLRMAAPVRIEDYAYEDFSISGTAIDFAATMEGDALSADLDVRSGVDSARIGRLTLSDAPFASSFRIEADVAAKTANVYNKEQCITLDRARARLDEYNADATLGRTQLCNNEGPLAVFTWSGDTVCTLNGEITAASGRFRMGETRAAGAPPVIRFAAVYNPANNTTTIDGDVSEGSLTINEAITLSAIRGRFDFSLDQERMRANGVVDRVRVAQAGETQLAAPVIANGDVSLDRDKVSFDYALKTPSNMALGAGEGVHDLASARGDTTFSFDGLRFTPNGVQPNALVPGLKGIVTTAEGGVDGEVRFGWSKEGVTSGADISLNTISFGGPTRAVTRTIGLNGAIALTDLMPVTTDGAQQITIDAVDLDALQLEDGALSFEFPGDDTIYLARGEFPWFGGTLGVYEATASLSGEARIPLRAENIDLKKILDYVDVDGLSGEGLMTGSLPLVFENGKARIEDGVLQSVGPGVVRYAGAAGEQAAQAGDQAEIAFDILRDLQYSDLQVTVNGALDGRLEFNMVFEGTGEVSLENAAGRVPVKYRINLDAALLELLRQANLTTDIRLQLERAQSTRE
ncbi:intermembrane phospholipid transport protein YdbH family protein [Hyphococcus sp.]|uniref:intermembrane phospholipid transport protein YdbH family protein n=1 Tax=Hyphococcus sp. TaxID=2038636 RepID=UPI003CCC10DB